jgi:hypothetical protein
MFVLPCRSKVHRSLRMFWTIAVQCSGAATNEGNRQNQGAGGKRGRGILTADCADFRGWERGINTAETRKMHRKTGDI